MLSRKAWRGVYANNAGVPGSPQAPCPQSGLIKLLLAQEQGKSHRTQWSLESQAEWGRNETCPPTSEERGR